MLSPFLDDSFVLSYWRLGTLMLLFTAATVLSPSPDTIIAAAAASMLHTGAKAEAGRQQLLAIAGLACSRFSPRTLHLCFWVSWGRLSRKGLFQRREKQDGVRRGAPDGSTSCL
eukprot:1141692-Pelagomonas_calceolata.AAC.8